MGRKRVIQEEFFSMRPAPPDYGPEWGIVTPTWPENGVAMLCRSGCILQFAARYFGQWHTSPWRIQIDPPTHCLRRRLVMPGGGE